MDKEECIKTIMAYRREAWVRPKRHPGDQKGPCMRCGSERYDFDGRYKSCPDCGMDTYFEEAVRSVRYSVKHGSIMPISFNRLNETCKYIKNLEALTERRP